MKLTGTNIVLSRIAMVLFLCRNQSSRIDLKIYGECLWNILKILAKKDTRGGPPKSHKLWGRAYPPACVSQACGPPGPPTTLTPTPYIPIHGEKSREKDSSHFTIRSRCHLLFFIGRADLESVRAFGEGDSTPSSSSTFIHHQFHDAHH